MFIHALYKPSHRPSLSTRCDAGTVSADDTTPQQNNNRYATIIMPLTVTRSSSTLTYAPQITYV